MVLASVRQMNEAVERLVEDRVQKLKARLQREVSARGRKRRLELVEAGFWFTGVGGSQQSNRRLPGARLARQEAVQLRSWPCAGICKL